MNKPLFDQHRNIPPSRRRGNAGDCPNFRTSENGTVPLEARTGFTLVEMLVVITIIGILVGLTIPAVMVVRVRANNFVIKSDISELERACLSYKAKYGEFPPDGTNQAAVNRHVRKVFPRYAGNAPTGLNPFNSLTFWLGGIWDNTNRRFIGFSADPSNPFGASASRTTPFFEFDPNRVVLAGYIKDVDSTNISPSVRYWTPKTDGNKGDNIGAVAYFRADDGSYLGKFYADNDTDGDASVNSSVVYPAQDSRLTTDINNPIWINPKTFQIFSAGLDGLYGNPGGRINFPSGEATGNGGYEYKENTYDDITNFSDGTLEDSMP